MISFSIETHITGNPKEFLEAIFIVENWTSFSGWGPIPGIDTAILDISDDSKIGTTIDVTNKDGSTHRETVVEYVPGERLVMRMDKFSAPLARFASHFLETWDLEKESDSYRLVRSFELYPKNTMGKIVLPIVSIMLKKAVRKHTLELAQQNY